MKAAVEHVFTGTTEPLTGTYNSNKTMLGSLTRQATGASYEDKFISTKSAAMVNIGEVFTSSNQFMPHVYKWSDNIYWIFTASNATAAATRTISLTEFNSSTSSLTYKGFITLSGTTVSGNKTVRSLRGLVYEHTSGTVSTSGSSTTITGSGTQFTTDRIAVGSRIGFGTTEPTEVTTWYEISAITNDTSLIINSAVNLSAGTQYVIEEIRIVIANTNATLINSGIHLIKGLNYSTFTSGGVTITEATTVDNIRASYLLRDGVGTLGTATATVSYSSTNILSLSNHGFAIGDPIVFTTTGTLPTGLSTGTTYYVISTNIGQNQFSVSTTLNGGALSITAAGSGVHTVHSASCLNIGGFAIDDEGKTATSHNLYSINATAAASGNGLIVKYNIRAALTVGSLTGGPASGTTVSAFLLKTASVATTGTITQLNGCRIFSLNHGAYSGVKSLFFTSSSRIYRCPVSSITSASTTWLADAMLENPPGGTVTYSSGSNMAQVDYASSIDRLLIANSGRFGVYITQYVTDGSQFDKYVGANLTRLKLSSTPSGASDGLFPQSAMTIWTEDGWMFSIPNSTTSGQNWLYVFPFGADAFYNSTTNQHIITPKLATTGATKLHHAYVDHQEYAGTYGLGFPVESYRLWYRTSGIDDNSGAWTEISIGEDLSAAAPGSHIQFKIAFDILGEICVPTRIYSICCTYEDSSQDSHYQPSLTKSSAASRIFAWKQVSAWGSNIPDLQIRLYNADTNALVLDDTVNISGYGTWQYSTNGTVWNSWSAAADAVGNYIRYTAETLPNNITVRALVTEV